MKRYRVRYRDNDPCCPVFSCIVKAYDREHLEERLADFDYEGWKVLSTKALQKRKS